MKRKTGKATIRPFYKTASKLLKIKVKSLKDVKKFYTGVNNLGYEILANTSFTNSLDTYSDTPKLITAVNYVLGYAKAVEVNKSFFNPESGDGSQVVKEIDFTKFNKRDPRKKLKMLGFQLEAHTYFHKLKKFTKYTEEDRKRDEATHEMVKELCNQLKPKNFAVKNKHTVNLVFPEPFKWEKVKMQFKDGMKEIEIYYDKKHIATETYLMLGFSANKKDHKPDRKWRLLEALSYYQETNFVNATPNRMITALVHITNVTMTRDNLHQTKKQLSNSLKQLFKTNFDPFKISRKYYEPKFEIQPSPEMRNRIEFRKQGKSYNDKIEQEDLND